MLYKYHLRNILIRMARLMHIPLTPLWNNLDIYIFLLLQSVPNTVEGNVLLNVLSTPYGNLSFETMSLEAGKDLDVMPFERKP